MIDTRARKRICYVENCADGTVGGSFLFMYDLATHLDGERFEPVACFHQENLVADWFRRRGIETHVFIRPQPISFERTLGASTRIQRIILSVLRPIQQALNFSVQVIWLGIKRARFLRKQRIDLVDLNNSITRNHEWMVGALLARVKCVTHEAGLNSRFSWLTRKFLPRLDGIICCSHAIADNMRHRSMVHDVMPVVHSCIAPERLEVRESPSAVRARLGIEDASPVIGQVATIRHWKGQETVVRATAMLAGKWPKLKCLLVGGYAPSEASYYTRLKALASEFGIESAVVFTGFQERPIDIMNVMDVVIHASIEAEPFGMTNLEAMSLGKPVVATNMGGPTEVFEDNVSGLLIPPGDPEVLAKAVDSLLTDNAKASRIGQAAIERFEREFSFARAVERTQEVYLRILGTR